MAITQQKAGIGGARFDGVDLRAMFATATDLFERNVETINALNVFPVPDGDTGTNMFLTLREVVRRAEEIGGDSAGDVAAAMAKGALFEARGNSGVILSQFFKGVALGLQDKPDFDAAELATSFEHARDHSYRAVGDPVEGTMLTVISKIADSARESADADSPLGHMIESACVVARDTVALTPTMLPALREAGVVDAGGQGLAVILEGIRLWLAGEQMGPGAIAPPDPIGVEAGRSTVTSEFLEASDHLMNGYCTQFLIQGQELDPDAVRDAMSALAESVVVVGDDAMVKVHVHVHDPGPVVSAAVLLGALSQVKIEDMDEQHRDYSVARRREVESATDLPDAAEIAVVAVVSGQGIEAVFSDFGAVGLLRGGDTMNPSIQQILDVVEEAHSPNVILLPNNGNVVPAARQAVELSTKTLRIVPSTSMPQGIAAMLAFSVDRPLDDNVSEMERTLASVRTGEVCEAVRETRLRGVSVAKGDLIGLLDRDLAAAGRNANDVLVQLVSVANVGEGDLVTLYWGGPLTEQDADEGRRLLQKEFPGIEVEAVCGGQPHYHYIVSIEEDSP